MPGGIAGWRWLIAGLALAILTAACGGSSASAPGPADSQPAPLNVELDWVPNPDHVGFYYAQHRRYFARQHLMVNFRVPSSAADPLKLVGLGQADLAISYEPELFYAQQEHLPVTAVAAVIPVPLNGLIVSPKLGITSLCQIKGHSVGFTGVPSDYAFYSTLLRTCHLARQQVPYQTVGYNLVPSILPIGCLDLAAWRDFGNWLKANQLVHDTPDAAAIMTNKYLPHPSCPGQGEA